MYYFCTPELFSGYKTQQTALPSYSMTVYRLVSFKHVHANKARRNATSWTPETLKYTPRSSLCALMFAPNVAFLSNCENCRKASIFFFFFFFGRFIRRDEEERAVRLLTTLRAQGFFQSVYPRFPSPLSRCRCIAISLIIHRAKNSRLTVSKAWFFLG